MQRVAADVPAESSLLCEGCGYTLDGLPAGSNCPECGKPVLESTTGDGRQSPRWETDRRHRVRAFVRTTWEIIVAPSRFFRQLTTRGEPKSGNTFARIHWGIASVYFTAAAVEHWNWYARYLAGGNQMTGIEMMLLLAATYVFLWGTTGIAARLTTWEARYRGIRLSKPMVRRGLNYHAAHYLPVAFGAWFTTALYQRLLSLKILGLGSANAYLYVLSAEVILAAAYLFKTYWAAMRNMMYANR
jgi:hypothetical protein